jgi:hypothetical protein
LVHVGLQKDGNIQAALIFAVCFLDVDGGKLI